MKQNKSHLTAIYRKELSAPMKWLISKLLIKFGIALDYGCGRGSDADIYGFYKYDPYYFPDTSCLTPDTYDTIICNYVLNVIEDSTVRDNIVKNIKNMLKSNGEAYIIVRRDVKKEGYTTKGTYQCNVVLNLPVVHEKKNNYCIYKLTK